MKKSGLFKRTTLLCGLLLTLSLTACGGSSEPGDLLIGTWLSDSDEMVVFEEDGSCSAPFTYNPSWWESAERYTVKEDGTLVLSSETGHADGSYEKVDTEDEALDDDYTYFVSEDTLIIEGETYTKSN